MRRYDSDHELFAVDQTGLRTANNNVQIHNWDVLELGFVEFADEHLVVLLVARTQSLFEMSDERKVVLNDYSADQNSDYLGLLNKL